MSASLICPECGADYVFENDGSVTCMECGHVWSVADTVKSEEETGLVVKDSNGTLLQDGDTVTVIKDLKVKGSSSVVKVGTKVKNIRLVAGDHDIDCKIPGIGAMGLKSEFVKKVTD
jgi:protein PhnA